VLRLELAESLARHAHKAKGCGAERLEQPDEQVIWQIREQIWAALGQA
tara:strand:+ start:1878 stop:2021 length:144 start_codon:yes stop_codon:yes gene_type:complete